MKSKFLLLAAGTALALAAGTVAAKADIIPIPAGIIDPTDLHVGGSGAAGADPVVVPGPSFTISSTNATTTVPQPIDIFYAVPHGFAAPTISGVTGPGGALTFVAPTLFLSGGVAVTLSAGQDLYTQVGCTPCDNSLSFSNFIDALKNDILPPITGVTSFDIYEAQITQDLSPQTTDTISGTEAVGTFIAPLGTDGKKVFDTSFTNTGLIGLNNPDRPVPEPASMFILGTALLGFGVAMRRRRFRS